MEIKKERRRTATVKFPGLLMFFKVMRLESLSILLRSFFCQDFYITLRSNGYERSCETFKKM